MMTAIPPGGEQLARDFYIELLGLLEIPKPASLAGRGGLWLATGSLEIHLGIDPAFVPARKAHIALLVDDLDTLRDNLTANGFDPGPIESEVPTYRRCYVEDPFGNRVELMQSQ